MWKSLLNLARRSFLCLVAWASPLSLLLFLIGMVMTYFTVMLGVMAGYHPNVSHAPYIVSFIWAAIVYTGVFFVLGTVLLLPFLSPRAKRPIAIASAIVALSVPVTALAIVATTEPQPDTFMQYAGYDAYRVPRVFTRTNGDQEPGDSARVSVTYCINNSRGVYERTSGECHLYSFSLSKGDISSSFEARDALETLQVPRDGDKILDVAALARKTDVVHGDSWTGYTKSDRKTAGSRRSSDVHIVLDHDNRIVVFGRCMERILHCRMVSQTTDGLLSFAHPTVSGFDYQGWKAREARALDMLRPWRDAVSDVGK